MSVPSASRSKPIVAAKPNLFPKEARLLRSADFRRIYDEGIRIPGPWFVAFCSQAGTGGPKIGLTVSRALGKSVARNRIKRRIREAVRRQLGLLGPQWEIVINARRAALTVPFDELSEAMKALFVQCTRLRS